MCTHNQCLRAKKEKYNFSSENYYFYSREKSLCIAWACIRNVWFGPVSAVHSTSNLVFGSSFPSTANVLSLKSVMKWPFFSIQLIQ